MLINRTEIDCIAEPLPIGGIHVFVRKNPIVWLKQSCF